VTAVISALVLVAVLGILVWMLATNPNWRGNHARVLALGVIIPFAVVAIVIIGFLAVG